MPVLFPIGIQFSAFLFAQNATVFNKLEGKITYFPFSSSCIPIWRKKKNHSPGEKKTVEYVYPSGLMMDPFSFINTEV